MAKYRNTGIIPTSKGPGSFADNFVIPDFQESLNIQVKAQEMFNALDANIRAEFKNDPAQLMDFLEDPENRARGEEIGLINPKPKPTPQEQHFIDKLDDKQRKIKEAEEQKAFNKKLENSPKKD